MVQYKRKPVKHEPLPQFLEDNTEIWAIQETGEVFTDYEKYLNKRDFYSQKSFTCEATGHSNYTFFEAFECEMEASKEVKSIFPEGLRARVLQFVQFRNTARMDDLVNIVFDHFRDHYSINDRVAVDHDNTKRYGVITNIEDSAMRQHPMYGGHPGDDQFRSFTYHITLEDTGDRITKYKASELQRDRKTYSKLVLKQFLRGSITRDTWNGAPWTIKDHLAKRYDISTKMPDAKSRDAVLAAKKAAIVPISNSVTPSGEPPNLANGINGGHAINGSMPTLIRSPFPGPAPNAFVTYNPPPFHSDHARAMLPPPTNGHPRPGLVHDRSPFDARLPHYIQINHPPHIQAGILPGINSLPHHLPPPGPGLPISVPFQTNFMQYQALPPTNVQQQAVTIPLAKPYEPVKYPMEDLRIKQPRVIVQRPPMKFFSDDVPTGAEPPENQLGINMKSMGPLLCAWETLNVHDTVYSLDSFTFDDFVDAMRFSSDEIECELLVEVHCAVLKQIVDESGKLQTSLPTVEDSEDSDDESSSKSTSPEPEPEPPVRTTRSSLRKSEANAIIKPRTPTPEPPMEIHKAPEFLNDFDWIEQCKIRNFRNGGWQAILVGLLFALSHSPVHKAACDEILAGLVPADEDPSVENIAENYVSLDVNLRISALDLALQLTVVTETFRDQLTAASQEMTRLRKEKIEFQKKRKELADELFKLDNERKIHLPLNMPASPTEANGNHDISMTGVGEPKEEEPIEESSEEPRIGNRKLRHTKQNKRKRESEQVKKEKAKKAKAEAAKTKQQKEWEKLLVDIDNKKEELKDCEANINELDDDLRETLVHRSKFIGKDRFLNKYYWFEHNGMPFGGVPNSSTAEYGYANGRLWIQGPDEYELQPNLEEPAVSEDLKEFGFTIPQRKEREEGSTHLTNSTEWGYYDDPSDLDNLIKWLDERGIREKGLRKGLQAFRDRIAEYMLKMKAHLTENEQAKADGEENATRVSTRTKTYVDKEVAKDRCLLWTNSIMREELGYNHAEEYEPPKKGRRGVAKASKGKGRK